MMKNTGIRSLLLGLLAVTLPALNACKITAENESPATTSSSGGTNSSTVYDCTNYQTTAEYNDLTSCKLTTNSNCYGRTVSFPNGMNTTCFTPPTGWAQCVDQTTLLPKNFSWIYTKPTLVSTYYDPSPGVMRYFVRKSLIGCENATCLCNTPAVDPVTQINETVTTGVNLSTCTTTDCGDYIYNGSIDVGFMNAAGTQSVDISSAFTLTVPGSQTIDGQLASLSKTPTISVAGGPPGFSMKVYSDSTCGTQLGSAVTIDNAGVGTVSNITVSSSFGRKDFYVKFSSSTATGISFPCMNTGKYYLLASVADIIQPANRVFPTTMLKTGTAMSILFKSKDSVGISYACKFDRVVDGTASAGTNCATGLASLAATGTTPSFSTTSGELKWTPSNAAFGPFEFCVTATQVMDNSTSVKCSVVQVVSNQLVMSNLTKYFDAQFASKSGKSAFGQLSNSYTVAATDGDRSKWNDIMSGNEGTFTCAAGDYVTNVNGWYSASTIFPDALLFNVDINKSSYATLSTALTNTNGSFMIDGWFYAKGPGHDPSNQKLGFIFDYYSTAAGSKFISLLTKEEDSTHFKLNVYTNPNNTSMESGNESLEYAKWYHFALIYRTNSTKYTLYVNGVVYLQGTVNTPIPIESRKLIAGSHQESYHYFNGGIANIRFYDSGNTSFPKLNYCAEKVRFESYANGIDPNFNTSCP
jgi:hypothetical protein